MFRWLHRRRRSEAGQWAGGYNLIWTIVGILLIIVLLIILFAHIH